MGLFVLVIMALAGAVALASAIQYFVRPGPWVAFGQALLVTGVFLIFAMSGVWEDTTTYDWGPLAILFAILLVCGFAAVKCGQKLWQRHQGHKP